MIMPLAPLWNIRIVDGLIIGLVGLAAYLFFLSVGSGEYDNGIQAQQLETAFAELKAYSNRRPRCQWLDRASRPLVGVMRDFQYEQAPAQLQHGDLIAFVTDRATDARSCRDEMFGRQRLLEVAACTPWRDANHLCLRVNQAMVGFTEDLPQHDDQATLVVGYRPLPTEPGALVSA